MPYALSYRHFLLKWFIISIMKLTKRFLPLYIGIFFQGLVFWYAIEKLFMTNVGFTPQTIGVSVALLSVTVLIVEIPSGILADRWSRKGALILSSIALVACSLVGAISTNVPTYLICSSLWGLYIALYSGNVESIIYDVLLEEKGYSANYEHEFGKTEVFYSAALILGGVSGGIISQFIGLRETFWLSVPTALISIIFLYIFKEPKLHKENQNESLIKHIKLTFRSVFRNKDLTWLLISLLASMTLFTILIEMSQLWLIALFAPVILYSVMQSLNTSIFGIGGMLSRFIKTKRNILIGILLSLLSLLCLIFSHNVWVIILAVFIILLVVWGINVVITHKIQDSLPSQVRAGSLSAIGSVGRILIIPSSLFFGFLATNQNISIAGWFLVLILLIAMAAIVISRYKFKK